MRFKDLLRFRSVWLGVAMIWTILYHIPIASTTPLDFIRQVGYAGVDIFLFASGVVCFYSLTKDPDAGRFMKRRIAKLAPCYLIFLVFWLGYQWFRGNFDLRMALGNALGIQYFINPVNAFNWYISAILLFYLLSPYFKAFIDRSSAAGRIIGLGLLVVFSIPFWNFDDLMIVITRLPIFFGGMLFANLCLQDKKISAVHLFLTALSFLLGVAALLISNLRFPQYLWSRGLHWYPFILITPPLCIALSYLAMLLEKARATRLLVSFLSLMGEYSFEIYLVHVLQLNVLLYVIGQFGLIRFSHWIWIGACLALIPCCYLLRLASKLCLKLCAKLFAPKTPSAT